MRKVLLLSFIVFLSACHYTSPKKEVITRREIVKPQSSSIEENFSIEENSIKTPAQRRREEKIAFANKVRYRGPEEDLAGQAQTAMMVEVRLDSDILDQVRHILLEYLREENATVVEKEGGIREFHFEVFSPKGPIGVTEDIANALAAYPVVVTRRQERLITVTTREDDDPLMNFVISFRGFDSDTLTRIRRVMLELTLQKTPPFKVISGSSDGRYGMHYQIKWLRRGNILEIMVFIEKACREQGIAIQSQQWDSTSLTFAPMS